MKKLSSGILLSAIVIMSSCTVKSLHPIYDEESLTFDEEWIGSWMDKDSAIYILTTALDKTSTVKNEIQYSEEKINSKSFVLDVKESEEDSISESMTMHFARLGNTLFWDLYPRKNYLPVSNIIFFDNLIPVHTFGKIEVDKDQLVVYQFRDEWLEDLFEQNKIRIPHEKILSPDGIVIVLTASTKELQKFIVKYQNDEDAFETMTFKKLSK